MSDRPSHGFSLEQSNKSDVTPSTLDLPHQSATTISSLSGKPTMPKRNPSTPVGKVVDAGQEQTGRWTREEHQAFLAGLNQYGKEWKKVAAKVKTRTVVQTRTHAQKYFQKLQKGLVDSNDFDMGILESKKSSSAKKRSARQKQAKEQQKDHPSILSTTQQQQQQQQQATILNNQAAAQLVAISQIKTQSEDPMMMSNKPPPPTSFFSLPSETNPQPIFNRSTQSFQSMQSMQHNQPQIRYNATGVNAFGNISFAASLPQTMKIIPPNPEDTIKKNMFPEPSPAACGSRKVIELAAAKMMAAVGNKSMKALENFSGNITPPLPSTDASSDTKDREGDINNGVMAGSGMKRLALGRLQIVNPEMLGEKNGNKRRNVGNEPTTPWDGQLAALGR
jgi:SHAQKYF class myb-like DNA-binding protein